MRELPDSEELLREYLQFVPSGYRDICREVFFGHESQEPRKNGEKTSEEQEKTEDKNDGKFEEKEKQEFMEENIGDNIGENIEDEPIILEKSSPRKAAKDKEDAEMKAFESNLVRIMT